MTKPILKYVSIILTIYLLSFIVPTIHIYSVYSLFIMGLVLLVVDLILKPILLLLTIPISLITLGLFSFVVNAWMIMLADHFVTGISMGGFLNSLLASFIIMIFKHWLKENKKESD